MDFNWTCEYCGSKTVITSPNFSESTSAVSTHRSSFGVVGIQHRAIACPNSQCRALSLVIKLRSIQVYPSGTIQGIGNVIHEWRLMPESKAKPQPDFIPESIRRTYYEACRIVDLSPSASAALARRCLQGMIRDFWQIPDGKRSNLGAEISYIKDKVDSGTLRAIHGVRSIGDIGAHMDKYVDQVVDVEPEEAELLVGLIETLLENWYVERHELEMRTKTLDDKIAAKRALQKEYKAARKSENTDSKSDPEVAD